MKIKQKSQFMKEKIDYDDDDGAAADDDDVYTCVYACVCMCVNINPFRPFQRNIVA